MPSGSKLYEALGIEKPKVNTAPEPEVEEIAEPEVAPKPKKGSKK